MDPLDLMSDTTSDSDDLGAMLGELDGDLEFFDGLFEDLKHSSDALVSAAVSGRSDRRRQRWQPSISTTEEDSKLVRKGNGSSSSSSSLGWKEIAVRQKKQRAAAETLNAELRKVLAAHMEANWKMLKLTQRANRLAMRIPATSVDPTKPYAGPPADLARIHYDLNALVREAEAARAAMSGATVSMDVQVLTQENRIVQTAAGAALESTLKVAWVMPFTVDAIVDALAVNTIRPITKTDGREATTLFESSGFKVVQAVTHPKVRNGLAVSKHGQLSTRCEPADKDGSRLLVLVARGALVTEDACAIVAIEADGYVIVSPVPGHDSEKLGPLSRIQWCHRFRYQPSKASRLSREERATLIHGMTSKAARKSDRKVDKVTQAMENLLLSSDKGDRCGQYQG